jgi:hypothetical protein
MMSNSDSSFSRFEDSRYLPSDVETRQIQELISLDEQEGLRLDAEIAAAHATVDQLQLQRKKVGMTISIRKATISPIRRLPPEILGYIFLLAIPHIRYVRPDSRSPPLTLRQICKAWKAIAESTSNLWSSIDLNFNWSKGVESQLSDGIQGWLSRSSSHPINIEIGYQPGFVDGDDVPNLDQLFDMLMLFAIRWRYVSLCIPLHMMQRLLGCHESPLSMLHSLELHSSGPTVDVPTVSLTDSATALRRIILHGHFTGSQWVALPWHQLTHLITKGTPSSDMSVAECMAIIGRSPRLEYGSFRLSFVAQASAPCPTTHLQLSTFMITGKRRFILTLLDNLTLPALRRLTIDFGGPKGKGWLSSLLPHLTSLISRSSCTINSIYIPNQMPFRDEEREGLFVRFVEQFPSLLRVDIKYGGKHCFPSQVWKLLANRRLQDKTGASYNADLGDV